MNVPPESRSKPHCLLLVSLTDGKPKDFPGMLSPLSKLSDFMVRGRWWRPIVSFVSGDLPALADCAGVQGHVCFFGCVRCYMSATRVGGLYYLGHARFLHETHPNYDNSFGPRPRDDHFSLPNSISASKHHIAGLFVFPLS